MADNEEKVVASSQQKDCIFCRRHNERLNRIMCENDSFFARHDNYPAAAGHIEIVPKRHVESVFDLTEREVVQAYPLMRKARSILTEAYDLPHGYTIGINEGKAAGQSIKHLHIHMIPRYVGDVEDPRGGIRQAAPNWNPDSWL
ncbi:HIT family protein [Nonomuraea fuscirosea]|uniref:HIT family protein n=1 Tax=Nonomuraea fuscirosea TaxID=1291556 RepID=UPI00340C3335